MKGLIIILKKIYILKCTLEFLNEVELFTVGLLRALNGLLRIFKKGTLTHSVIADCT